MTRSLPAARQRTWNRQSLSVERRAIEPRASHAPVRFALPFPPPSPGLFVTAPSGERVASSAFRAWRNAASWEIRTKAVRRTRGPVAVALTFEHSGARAELTRLARAPLLLLTELM